MTSTATKFLVTMSLLGWLQSLSFGAISVGPGGTDVQTFDTAPAATEWTTLFLYGGTDVISNATSLEATVQALNANDITNALSTTATFPPSASGAGIAARWNSQGQFLQTRPAGGSAGNVLMTTLRNDTGAAQRRLVLSYEMTVFYPVPAELPGYGAYYSLTGVSSNWQLIPELSGIETAGVLRATLNLGSWTNGSLLYLLWIDDNGAGTTDPAYTIDDLVIQPLAMLAVTRLSTSQAEITWPLPSIGYLLESKPDSSTPIWEAVPELDLPTNGFHHVTVETRTGAKFFRLRMQ